MTIHHKVRGNVSYHLTPPDYVVLSHDERGGTFTRPFLIRDIPRPSGTHADIRRYFSEVCSIFSEQLKEFEALERKATKSEQKRLELLLNLMTEAQELLYDTEL